MAKKRLQANPSFKNGEKAFLTSKHRGRTAITQVTIVNSESFSAPQRGARPLFFYTVRSDNGGETTAPEDALTSANALDRLLLETRESRQ